MFLLQFKFVFLYILISKLLPLIHFTTKILCVFIISFTRATCPALYFVH
jgi:hypothetical protein